MRYKFLPFLFLGFLCSSGSLHAQSFFDNDYNAYTDSYSWTPRYLQPATYDSRIDPSLIRAARIAEQRAGRHSLLLCWHYVKAALVEDLAVSFCPKTAYACQAGSELVALHGFVRLPVSDPYRAPVGSVIVYSGHGAGHVELRTAHGFASDYRSIWACHYHLVGVYARLAS